MASALHSAAAMLNKSFLLLSLVLVACAAPSSEEDDAAQSQDEALGSTSRSGFDECPGLGWTQGAPNWNGVKGTYMRSGSTATITVFEDPNTINQGAPNYLRMVNGLPESGRIGLGVDNPAIGPVLGFFPNGVMREPKDLHWVLAQKRSITGKITGMCLAPADSASDPSLRPFYLARLGF